MGNKQGGTKDKFSKDDRKHVLFVLKLPSDKDHITKDDWFSVVVDRGMTMQLSESIWNALSNGCKVVEKNSFLQILESCILGSEVQKLHMSFNVFDIEREQQLNRDGVARVFEICFLHELTKTNAEAKLTDDHRFEIQYMTSLIFKEAGLNDKDEKMTRDVFVDIANKNPEVGKILRIF